ncbi:MAG: hypothetical protein ACE5NG_12870 [bacterium]
MSGGVMGGAAGVAKGASSAVSEPARTYQTALIEMIAQEYNNKA